MQSLFDAQHRASRAHAVVPLAVRRERLLKIRTLLDTHGGALAQALRERFIVRGLGRGNAAPASVTVIGRDELAARNATDLLDAVRGAPGLTLSPRQVGGRNKESQ